MKRGGIVVAVLIGLNALTGCAVPWTAGVTPVSPPPPSMGGGPPPMTGPKGPRATVWAGGGVLTDNVNDSYVKYGGFDVSGTESDVQIPFPFAGTVSNLHVEVTTAPGGGASWTLTFKKNGAATALTCSIAGASTSCNDSSNVTIAAGNLIDLDVTPFGRPARGSINWSATITP